LRNYIIIISLFITISIFSQKLPNYNKLISASEKLAYNFEFDSCKSLINTAIKLSPERPEAFQVLSKIHLWYFLGSKENNDYKQFFEFSDSTLLLAEKLLDEDEENTDLLYLFGNIFKYRAMAYGTGGSTLDAFWATKKAVSFYEDVIDLDSNYYDAYGGIGIFEYALSYVPALFNWALSLSGLSADQKNGFEFIQIASQKGQLDKTEYKFHLSKLFDEHLADYEKSLGILNKLIKKFPLNPLFHYQAAIEYIKSKNLKLANEELLHVLEINHPKFIQTNSFSNFLLGDIHFRQNNFKLAKEYYHTFLITTKTIDYTGIASLRTAYCNYFLDDEQEFKKYALLAANGNLDLEDDKYAHQMSFLVLENGFSGENKFLVEIENEFLSGKYDSTLYLIENSIDSIKSDDILAQMLIYKSKSLINLQKTKEANFTLEKIDSLEIEYSDWIEPLSLFYKAEVHYLDNKFELAKDFLNSAESSNDYQKKNLIQSYINGLKIKLDKVN